jgi:hypothetical protein
MADSYQQFCENFMKRGISTRGNEIHIDAAVVQDLVNAHPQHAEKWFFEALRSGKKDEVELLYPLFAMVAAILKGGHGIDGPANCFKSK